MEGQQKTVLVTGGAGYIGSHTVVELLTNGYRVVVVDDLSNSKENKEDNLLPPSLQRAVEITGKREELIFYRFSSCDYEKLDAVFSRHNIDAVFDFCGRKSVGESTRVPILYYRDNIRANINVTKCMRKHGVRDLIFSSSCTVYGAPRADELPIKETARTGSCHCPYAKCKYMIEHMLSDLSQAEPGYWRCIIFRYFNPVGAHPSGMLGEDPKGDPKNLMPKIAQVASGLRPLLELYGDDYDTPDGSPVRDYVHIMDVAKAHCITVEKIKEMKGGVTFYNIGMGEGRTTLQMIDEFERASGRKVHVKIQPRRGGDVPQVFCDPSKAERELGWKAELTYAQMCADLWNFYTLNPSGYQGEIPVANGC